MVFFDDGCIKWLMQVFVEIEQLTMMYVNGDGGGGGGGAAWMEPWKYLKMLHR